MTSTVYNMLNIGSALIVGSLGLVIAGVRISAQASTRHYRLARVYLSIAFVVLGVLKVAEVLIPKTSDDELTSCIALVVGSYQALCFTASLVLFISPRDASRPRLRLHFAVITLIGAVLILCQRQLEYVQFRYVLALCSLLYVCQLSYYTWLFVVCHRRFKAEMYAYYQEEDLNRQLRWISHTFYTSLAVGCLVFLSLSGVRLLDSVFIVIYTAFYIYLTVSFINYGQYVLTVMRAVEPAGEPEAAVEAVGAVAVPADEPAVKSLADTPVKWVSLSASLQEWVAEQRYLRSDVAVKDVAAELGTTIRKLNEYFSEVVGEDFVKWRIRLRLNHACRLLDSDPTRPILEVAHDAGFGDRSYFYRKFAEVEGMSVSEYKRKAMMRLASHVK